MITSPPTVNVSVIIPCFNNEDTIERALKSVEHQTVRPLEVLIVDDASSDRTREVVQRFAERSQLDLKVTVLPVNGGPARARNTAWDQAHGEYIAFLDADDAWHPRKLELQYRVMVDNPSLSISGHTFELSLDDVPFRKIDATQARFPSAQQALFSNKFFTPSVMLLRHLPHRFNEKKRYSEDYLLWLQIIFGGGKSALLNDPLFRMFKKPYGSRGLSADLFKMQIEEIRTFVQLAEEGLISRQQKFHSILFSLIKYIRRLIIARLST